MSGPRVDFDARLNQNHLRVAALNAALALAVAGVARVVLTPGDHSRYELAIIGRSIPAWLAEGELPPAPGHLVVLVSGVGAADAWDGQPVTPGQAAAKWTVLRHGDGGWVANGEVLSRFLNALSPLLQAAETGPA